MRNGHIEMVFEEVMADEILMEVRFEADPERQGPGLLTGTLMVYESRASVTDLRCLCPTLFTSQRKAS